MKVDVFTAPLSDEGKEILRHRDAAEDLLYKLLNSSGLGPFEVRAGERTFDVSSSTAPSPASRPTRPR
jgi:hypothetical protein